VRSFRENKGSISIQGLLAAYKARLRAPQGVVIDAVVSVCQELGVECAAHEFSYTPATKIVTVKVTGPKKMEILLRKQTILQQLAITLRPDDCPKDVL
jgi:hypothetical protein